MLRSVIFICLLSLALARVLIGDLVEKFHDVAGTVYAVNTRTLRIENFVYDGRGPAAAFWLDTGSAPTSTGRIPPFRDTCKEQPVLPRYTGETVEIELPPDLTIADIGYFSVWCTSAKTEFGGIAIDASTLENVPVLDEATCPVRLQEGTTDVFPVRTGWNCQPLNGNYQVRWRLVSNNTKVDFELVARLRDGDQWMGFGPSGSRSRTEMVGSDVAIAYRRESEFVAIDYHLSDRRPCDPATGEGVCPDTLRNVTDGVDDVTDVSGDFEGDVTMVRYSRPVKVTDVDLDKDIVIDGPSFVTWAYGPLKVEDLLPLFHNDDLSVPTGPVSIEFGREPKNNCARGFDNPVEEPEDIPGFVRPVLHNVTEIDARIGPSGGVRGVSAIIGRPSWGIAWYLSDTNADDEETTSSGSAITKGALKDILIPALGVERGKTYTFNVFGGIPVDDRDSSVHPFYITTSSVGGYARRTPNQRANEKVYAGIDQIEENRAGGVISYRATGTGQLCRLDTNATNTGAIRTYLEYYRTLNRSCVENPAITSLGGKLVWKVAENTPDIVYYQCVTHEDLGYKIRVFDTGKVDVAELRELSGGGPLEEEKGPDVSCIADFNLTRRRFDGCAKGLGEIVDVFWNVNATTKEIETLFRVPKEESVGYVGIGWGFKEMLGSSAVIAFQLGDSARIGDYFLEARNPEGVQPNSKQNLISSAADNSGDFLRGLFTRPLEVDGLPTITIGQTDLIWAFGPRPGSPRSFTTHRRRGRGSVDLTARQSTFEEGGNDVDTIFIIHGVFMGISWLLLVPLAITGIRFFKKYNPITFNIHRGINGVAVLLTIAGFIMAIISGSRTETAHLAIGCIVLVLAIVQVLAGILRPHKDKPLRKPWFWAHALLGSALSTLAIVNCFLGIGTEKIGGPVGWYVAAGAVTGLFVVAQVIFAFMPNTFPRADEEEKKAKLRAEMAANGGRTFVRED